MKKSIISVLMVGVLGVALLAVACGGGGDGDKSKTPNTNGGGGDYPVMKEVGGPAVGHSAADVAAMDCLRCHSIYSSKYDHTHVPTPGTWYSFTQKKFFTVDASSKANHTSYTNSQCFDDKCHTRP